MKTNKLTRRKLIQLGAIGGGAALLAACAAPTAAPKPAEPAKPAAPAAPAPTTAPAAPAAAAKKLLVYSDQPTATWVRNFNPFSAAQRFPSRVTIYESLMVFNRIKGEYVPWLGTEFKWSDGDKKLTFTTRSGVKWSDGKPFSAKDVAFTFNMMKEKKGLQGPASAAWDYLSSVTAPSDTSVEFNFSKAFTVGFFELATQWIVPENIWSKVDDPAKFSNETPVGTGPFTEVSLFNPQLYEVTKNPNYWQPGKPQFDGFRMPAYAGNDPANLATTNGENDLASNFIPDIDKTYVAKNPNYKYWFALTGITVTIYLNTTKKPFDDVKVRKAVSMALNRAQMLDIAVFNYSQPNDATGLSDGYPKWKDKALADASKAQVTFNVADANKLMDDAGLKKGADGIRVGADGKPLKFDINVVNGWTDWVSVVQIASQNLKQIGMDVTVKALDFGAFIGNVQKGEFDMTIGWTETGATPFNYYRGQMGTAFVKPVGEASPQNWQRFGNKEADALLDEMAGTSAVDKQLEAAKKLQKLYIDTMPSVPLYPGPLWYEYNTTRFEGFPSKENPYGVGQGGNQDAIIMYTAIKPK